jgi:hypothetical protein
LQSAHVNQSFNAVGDRININGQIKIHPDKLAQLQAEHPESFAKLLRGTKALEEQGGNFSKLSPEDQKLLTDLSGSNPKTGGQRLRFEYQLHQQVNGFLEQHGAQNQAIFRNMNDAERGRLFDLVNERPRQTIKDSRQREAINLEEQQAVNYALSQKPKSANEFVEQVQMYKAVLGTERSSQVGKYNSVVKQLAQEKYGVSDLKSLTAKQETEISRQASQEILGKAFDGGKGVSKEAYIQSVERAGAKDVPGQVNSATQSKVEQAYLEKAKLFEGKTGSVKINPNQSSDAIAQQIQELNATGDVKFGSKTAGVYHVEKHYEAEFPQGASHFGKKIEEYSFCEKG